MLMNKWNNTQRSEPDSLNNDSLEFPGRPWIRHLSRCRPAVFNCCCDNYASSSSGILNQRQVARFIGVDIRIQVSRIIRELHADGVIDRAKNELNSAEIIVRDARERTQQTTNIASMRDMEEAREFARTRLNRNFPSEIAAVAGEVFELVFLANYGLQS